MTRNEINDEILCLREQVRHFEKQIKRGPIEMRSKLKGWVQKTKRKLNDLDNDNH